YSDRTGGKARGRVNTRAAGRAAAAGERFRIGWRRGIELGPIVFGGAIMAAAKITSRAAICAAVVVCAARTSLAIVPRALEGVGFDQRLNEQVPLDIQFTDESGKVVQLGDYFGSKPVILVLAYYQCPRLCTLV